MAEYIEREAALNRLCNENCGHDYNGNCRNCYTSQFIENIAAADVAPVVHGRWESKRKMYRTPNAKNYTCSECGLPIAERWHYCPNCGAHMDGQQNGKEGN